MLDQHLIHLAKAYPLVKFLKARSSELQFATGSEADVLPTLLVYRNGQNLANLVAFHRELRPDGTDSNDEDASTSFGQKRVEEVLVRYVGLVELVTDAVLTRLVQARYSR